MVMRKLKGFKKHIVVSFTLSKTIAFIKREQENPRF